MELMAVIPPEAMVTLAWKGVPVPVVPVTMAVPVVPVVPAAAMVAESTLVETTATFAGVVAMPPASVMASPGA